MWVVAPTADSHKTAHGHNGLDSQALHCPGMGSEHNEEGKRRGWEQTKEWDWPTFLMRAHMSLPALGFLLSLPAWLGKKVQCRDCSELEARISCYLPVLMQTSTLLFKMTFCGPPGPQVRPWEGSLTAPSPPALPCSSGHQHPPDTLSLSRIRYSWTRRYKLF